MITYRMYAMTPILQRSTLLSYIFPLTTSGAKKTNILSVPADNVTMNTRLAEVQGQISMQL